MLHFKLLESTPLLHPSQGPWPLLPEDSRQSVRLVIRRTLAHTCRLEFLKVACFPRPPPRESFHSSSPPLGRTFFSRRGSQGGWSPHTPSVNPRRTPLEPCAGRGPQSRADRASVFKRPGGVQRPAIPCREKEARDGTLHFSPVKAMHLWAHTFEQHWKICD